jgi:hypothetical protein
MKFEQFPQPNNLDNQDKLTQKLKSLDQEKIDASEVATRTKQLNEKTEKDNLLVHADRFYAENLQNVGKSVSAEFKMRPIYKKYIAIEKENDKIYKENRRREKIKEKNPNATEETSLLNYLSARSNGIFEQAEDFKKIPEFVEKNKYNETNLKDLKSYQENYKYRRYPNAFVSDLRSDKENEYTILNRLYAIQLNQIREKLKNDQDIQENLDVYLQPATERYQNSDHRQVFSEKNAQPEKTEYSLSVVDRINALTKSFIEDKIVLSEKTKSILQEKIVELFETHSRDIGSSYNGIPSISALVALSNFKEDQKKILNSILFKLMLKNEKRHWFNKPFDNTDFPYTQEQIEIIFDIVKQTNINSDGIRVVHPDKKYYRVEDEESKYDVISIQTLTKFPFTNEQKQEIGTLISKSIEKEFDNKVANNDFRYFLNFQKEQSYLQENGFLTQEQFSGLTNLSDKLFFSATENYVGWSFGSSKSVWGPDSNKHYHMVANFDIAETSNLIKILEENSNNPQKASEILEKIPWKKSIDKMLNIQKRSRRAEYDPWINEIRPLAKGLLEHKALSLDNQKDGDILFEYIKKVGAKNLLNYFKLFKSLQVVKSVNELSVDIKDDLKKSFNIDADEICKNDPSNISLIINEMEKYRASFNTDLINESKDLPERILQSQYNRESFNSIIGGVSDTTLKEFKNKSNKNPELFTLPEGYEKVDVKIGEYGEKNSLDLSKNEEQIKSLLENQDLLNYHSKVFTTINSFKEGSMVWEKEEDITLNINNIFNSELRLIDEKLNNSKDNPKIIENLNKRKDVLQKQADNFNTFARNKKDFNNLINLMENYFKLIPDDFSLKQKILMELSFKDMSKKIPEQFEKLTNPSFVSKDPSVDSVNIFSEFIRSHVKEHYFDKKHGEHQKIETENKDLIKYLKKIWGAQDFEKSILAITENKIAGLEKGEIKNTKKDISLVPSKGMQRIVTGYLGGACTSRQSDKLAKGEFKNVVSYSIILDKDTNKQKFGGSFLFIETKTKTKEPVLIVRANNPAQGLVNSIDMDELIGKILDEAKSVAKRRNIPFVGVAVNQGVASNRTFVVDYYKKNFKANDENMIALEDNEETNFNGYNIHSKGNTILI